MWLNFFRRRKPSIQLGYNATIFEKGHGITNDWDKRGFSSKFEILNGEGQGRGCLKGLNVKLKIGIQASRHIHRDSS